MKNNYTLKTLVLSIFVALLYVQSYAQIRAVRVDPATNEVTIRNFGSANDPEDISGFWLCNFPSYGQLSGMTVLDGSLNLAVGSEVTITSSVNFPVADAEFALYDSSSFGSSASIQDYIQWGSTGHERESVAVSAGIWTAGTMLTVDPPYEYTGDGSENGIAFWQTALSIEGFEAKNTIRMFPNPTTNTLNLQLNNAPINASVTIFDMLGKTVVSRKINATDAVDVSSLVSGLYLVKIESNQGSQTKQFIKQ